MSMLRPGELIYERDFRLALRARLPLGTAFTAGERATVRTDLASAPACRERLGNGAVGDLRSRDSRCARRGGRAGAIPHKVAPELRSSAVTRQSAPATQRQARRLPGPCRSGATFALH